MLLNTLFSAVHVQAQTPPAGTNTGGFNIGQNDTDFTPDCGTGLNPFGDGNVLGCLALTIHYVFYWVPAIFAELMGKILDFFLGFSIDSNTYKEGVGEVIQKSWVVVRDITNIFFILILLYAAISTIINATKVNYKHIVGAVIINALLINFSLFITRVGIDISNVTAHVFYNQITVERVAYGQKIVKEGTGGYTPISEGIVAAYNPQKLIGGTFSYYFDTNQIIAIIKPLRDVLNNPNIPSEDKDKEFEKVRTLFSYDGSLSSFRVGAELSRAKVEAATDDEKLKALAAEIRGHAEGFVADKKNEYSYMGKFVLISILGGVIAFFTGLMFFKVAFVFIGRTVGLYLAMIFSPFAFMSRDIPMLNGVEKLGWNQWKNSMINYIVVPPIFLFFLYIIHKFLTSGFYSSIIPTGDQGLVGTALTVCIPLVIIFGLLEAARKTTLKYAGEFTKSVIGFTNRAAGLVGGAALGIATGGTALLGTRFGSRAAKRIATKTKLGSYAAANASTSRVARWTNSALNAAQNGSFDLRRTKLGNLLQNNSLYKKMDIKVEDKVSKYLGLGKERFEGGYAGQQKRRQEVLKKKIENRIDISHLSDDEAKAVWEKKVVQEAELEYMKKTFYGDVERLTKEKKELEEKLATAKKNNDTINADLLQTQLKAKQSELLTSFNNAKNEEKEARKMNAFQGSQDYQSFIDEARKNMTKKYGNVKNTGDLNKILKDQYVEELQNNSFWMKNGKRRKGIWTLGAGYGGASGVYAADVIGLGALGTTLSATALGSIAAERLAFEQEAFEAALKGVRKSFKKNDKKERIERLKDELKEYQEQIKNVIMRAMGITDPNTFDFDSVTEEQQKDYVSEKILDLEDEIDEADKRFKDAKNSGDQGAQRAAARTRARARDELNAMKNIWKDMKWTEGEIEKEQEKKDNAKK